MRNLLFLGTLFLMMACGGSSEVPFEALDIHYEGEVATYQYKGELFTGEAIEYYPSLIHHHHIEEGFEVLEEAFYPSGEKERYFPMKKGVKDSTCRMWFKSGQLQMEETYRNGELNGTVKVYGPTGELLDEKKYNNGKLVLQDD